MEKLFPLLAAFLLTVGLSAPDFGFSASLNEVAGQADKGINSAGQKVSGSTKGMRNATDSVGQKAAKATKSGADKTGGFFKKTSNKVEGWMKNLEKKVKD